MSKSGVVYPNPANQCWPEPVPFIYKNFAVQIFQRGDHITMIYDQDHEVRYVRMNAQHPRNVTPSWYGDSVGHYEGDTLVIDTVGQKSGPFAMLDLYGTPYTKALHVVERYRLIDYDEAKEGLDRDAKENFRAGAALIDRNYRGKHLQVLYTVEDPGVFTTAWSGTVTYGRGSNEWPETVCAENPHVYYGKDEVVPTGGKAGLLRAAGSVRQTQEISWTIRFSPTASARFPSSARRCGSISSRCRRPSATRRAR
jgi:hypothetical protein